ncbi:hypothetical protein CASFOL_039082 [Castilleja foliolosa]|uniref:VQ domain-containing protein n=1 Tax=Castilleja foliolosa TaxID=1961234 RepID=A0ABD3BGZ5_9LAMI
MQNLYSGWEQDNEMLYNNDNKEFSNPNLVYPSNFPGNNSLTNYGDISGYSIPGPEIPNQEEAMMDPGKPKRRRAKNSTSTQPTTFLNASITDFRALVQQHTGCHTNMTGRKGPITLCFAPTSHDGPEIMPTGYANFSTNPSV